MKTKEFTVEGFWKWVKSQPADRELDMTVPYIDTYKKTCVMCQFFSDHGITDGVVNESEGSISSALEPSVKIVGWGEIEGRFVGNNVLSDPKTFGELKY